MSSSNYPCPRCGTLVPGDATHCGRCGQPQPDRDDPPEAWLGRVIDGKYEVESILGVGGMGMVFQARRVLVGDAVALKVLFPRFLKSALQRRLFRDEAIAAARLTHSNVVTVFDAELSTEGGTAYIAMELLHGRTLKALLRKEAPIPPERGLPIMAQMLSGLAAAHQARIIHRDLKPDNIFLEERANGEVRVKLVDFGIAAMMDVEPEDEHRRLLGTLRYMAPEQCRGAAIDHRADLYALGVVFYEAFTRKRATGRTITAVMTDEVTPPNLLLPEEKRLPIELEDLLMALLAKRPEERPDTALDVRERVEAIERLLTAPPPVVAEPAPLAAAPPPTSAGVGEDPPASRTLLWIGLVLAGLVGIAGGVLYTVLGS